MCDKKKGSSDPDGDPAKFWKVDTVGCASVPSARREAHTAWFDTGSQTVKLLAPGPDGTPGMEVERTLQRGFLYHGGERAADGVILNDVWLFDATALRGFDQAPRHCPWIPVAEHDPSLGARRMGAALVFEPTWTPPGLAADEPLGRFVLAGGFEPLADGAVRTSSAVFELPLRDLSAVGPSGAVRFASVPGSSITAEATVVSEPYSICATLITDTDHPCSAGQTYAGGTFDPCDQSQHLDPVCYVGSYAISVLDADFCWQDEPACGTTAAHLEFAGPAAGVARWGGILDALDGGVFFAGAAGCEGSMEVDCADHALLMPTWMKDEYALRGGDPPFAAGEQKGRTMAGYGAASSPGGPVRTVNWTGVMPPDWHADASLGLSGAGIAPLGQYYDTTTRGWVNEDRRALLIGGSHYQWVHPSFSHEVSGTPGVHDGFANPWPPSGSASILGSLHTASLLDDVEATPPVVTDVSSSLLDFTDVHTPSYDPRYLIAATNAGPDRVMAWGGRDGGGADTNVVYTFTWNGSVYDVEGEIAKDYQFLGADYHDWPGVLGGNIVYDPWTDRAFLLGGNTDGVLVYERERRYVDEPSFAFVELVDDDGHGRGIEVDQSFTRTSTGDFELTSEVMLELVCPDGNANCVADTVRLDLDPARKPSDLDLNGDGEFDEVDLQVGIDGFTDGLHRVDDLLVDVDGSASSPHAVIDLVSPIPFAAGTRVSLSLSYTLAPYTESYLFDAFGDAHLETFPFSASGATPGAASGPPLSFRHRTSGDPTVDTTLHDAEARVQTTVHLPTPWGAVMAGTPTVPAVSSYDTGYMQTSWTDQDGRADDYGALFIPDLYDAGSTPIDTEAGAAANDLHVLAHDDQWLAADDDLERLDGSYVPPAGAPDEPSITDLQWALGDFLGTDDVSLVHLDAPYAFKQKPRGWFMHGIAINLDHSGATPGTTLHETSRHELVHQVWGSGAIRYSSDTTFPADNLNWLFEGMATLMSEAPVIHDGDRAVALRAAETWNLHVTGADCDLGRHNGEGATYMVSARTLMDFHLAVRAQPGETDKTVWKWWREEVFDRHRGGTLDGAELENLMDGKLNGFYDDRIQDGLGGATAFCPGFPIVTVVGVAEPTAGDLELRIAQTQATIKNYNGPTSGSATVQRAEFSHAPYALALWEGDSSSGWADILTGSDGRDVPPPASTSGMTGCSQSLGRSSVTKVQLHAPSVTDPDFGEVEVLTLPVGTTSASRQFRLYTPAANSFDLRGHALHDATTPDLRLCLDFPGSQVCALSADDADGDGSCWDCDEHHVGFARTIGAKNEDRTSSLYDRNCDGFLWCKAPKEHCSSNVECCSGRCDTSSTPNVCVPCKAPTEFCSSNVDCCSGSCDTSVTPSVCL